MSTAREAISQDQTGAERPGIWAQLKFLKPYWVSDEKWKARWMLGGIAALTLADIALTAGVGFGFQAALNALVAKQGMVFAVKGGLAVAGLAATSVTNNLREYLHLSLAQNWRGWLTQQFSQAWLRDKTYLRLQHSKRDLQNPEQRMTDNLLNVTQQTLNLGLGFFRSVIAFAAFSVLLWHISPLMVGAALVCATAAHFASHWTGESMRKLWRGILDVEAKFRNGLVRIRDNAKPIALAGLEPVETETLHENYNKIAERRHEFYKANWRTGLVGGLSMNSATVVPIALMAPKFFAGVATLGSLELTRQVYGQFYGALNWFPQGYAAIAGWSAQVGQLMEFQKDLDENKVDMMGPTVEAPAPSVLAPKPGAKGPQP